MIGSIFKIGTKGELSVTDDRVRLVPEFERLLSKEVEGVHNAGVMLMVFVYAVCDYYSPYVRVSSEPERMRLASNDICRGQIHPETDPDVHVAIFKYKKLQEHPLMEQYAIMDRARQMMAQEIDKTDAGIDKVMKVSERLSKHVLEMEKLEKVIMEKNAAIGGLSNMSRSLSIIEQKLRETQLKH
jgi:hypothetical protein